MTILHSFNPKEITRELCSLALPMAFTQLIAVGSGFIAMAMLSSFGHDVLAASALIFSARITTLIVGSSLLFSLSILIGHAFGEKEYLKIGNYVQLGWLFGLIISIPVLFVFWNSKSILLCLGQEEKITEIVQQFFRANSWNVIPFMLSVANQQLCFGTRKQKIDFIANLFGVVVLLSSAYSFVFGHFGFPQFGVAGLGYALSLQAWCYFLFSLAVLYFQPFFYKFELFSIKANSYISDLVHMIKVGWPICIQISGELLSFFVSAAIIGWLGVRSLAAYQIVTQYLFLVLIPLFALSQASGVIISQACGEKNFAKIKQIGRVSLLVSAVTSLIIALVFFVIPKTLSSVYFNIYDLSNQPLLKITVTLFFIFGVQQLFDSTRNTLTGCLRGALDTRFPMYMGLISIWIIGIPLGYLFGFTFLYGVSGFAIGETIGIAIGMLILFFRWKKILTA